MRRHQNALVIFLFLLSQLGEAQVRIIAPGSQPPKGGMTSEANYGPARFVDLTTLALFENSQGSHVLTDGEISMFRPGQFWTVGRRPEHVLLIPGREFDANELDRAVGKRVQVRGIARLIREKQYVSINGQKVDLDLVEHPILPVLPGPLKESDAPRMSITVFALKDRTYDSVPKNEPRSEGLARHILDDPGSYLGRKSRIYGQFRGRNLFGDLPEDSARSADDWVLKDGDTAMWVTGKAPQGKGWKLDPSYKGDSRSWLEVEGKPEVVNGIVYVKASNVVMAKAPAR